MCYVNRVILFYKEVIAEDQGEQILKAEKSKGIMLVNRETGAIQQETVFGDGALRFMYETLLGKTLWGFAFNTAKLSDWLGRRYDSPKSKKKIPALASIPGCAPEEAELPLDQYPDFNSFFTRKLKPGARPFDADKNILSSPADGRVFVYENLKPSDPVPVKGAMRTLNDLCKEELQAESLAVAVIRLAPVDYHRYHFPCDCTQNAEPVIVKGKYHSVNPVALAKRPDLYVENTRQITKLDSELFGRFYYLEIGAFGVGSIIQTSQPGEHRKLDEKGMFKFGGSTVILIFDNANIQWDQDLLKNTENGYETLIRMGMSIASKKACPES